MNQQFSVLSPWFMKTKKMSAEVTFLGSHLGTNFFFFLKFQYIIFLLSLHSSSYINYILPSPLLTSVSWLDIGISLIYEEFLFTGRKTCVVLVGALEKCSEQFVGTHRRTAGGRGTGPSMAVPLKVAPPGMLLELAHLGRPGPFLAQAEASLLGRLWQSGTMN